MIKHRQEWTIKPMRRQSKAQTDNVMGIRHRDLVEYTFRNGETHRGYVTALSKCVVKPLALAMGSVNLP